MLIFLTVLINYRKKVHSRFNKIQISAIIIIKVIFNNEINLQYVNFSNGVNWLVQCIEKRVASLHIAIFNLFE